MSQVTSNPADSATWLSHACSCVVKLGLSSDAYRTTVLLEVDFCVMTIAPSALCNACSGITPLRARRSAMRHPDFLRAFKLTTYPFDTNYVEGLFQHFINDSCQILRARRYPFKKLPYGFRHDLAVRI